LERIPARLGEPITAGMSNNHMSIITMEELR